jgi:hypothetical protein
MEFLRQSTAAILEIVVGGGVGLFNIVWGTVFGD